MFDWAVEHWFEIGTVGVAVLAGTFWLGSWFNAVNSDRRDFSDFMTGIDEKFTKITSKLDQISGILASSTTRSSPLRLTDLGEKISDLMSVKDWASQHASGLVSEAQEKEPFEVFELCQRYVREQFDADQGLQRSIRAGAYDVGTNRNQVIAVYEIELRDALLELTQKEKSA